VVTLEEVLRWVIRVAGAYYFAGFLYNTLLLYEYRLYKGVKLEKEYTNIDYGEEPKQTRIAVMVPAFREENVIGRTLDFLVKAAETYDPELVRVYVGTYPNDPGTRRIVSEFERNYPSLVEEVVNHKPGPTTKAQNLNNIYNNIKRRGFDLIGIHDAEDFIPPNIFDATNYWYVRRVRDDEKLAGLQFAVRAKADNYSLTNLVYLLMLRSSNLFLTAKNRGFVPSHGTGTYYKQDTLDEIAKRRGYIWDEKNFTEDFEISLYLYYVLGKSLFYIPYPYIEEYFPSSFGRAIKQLSRWAYGTLRSLIKHSKNIIRNTRSIEDLTYTAGFSSGSTSFIWWISIALYPAYYFLGGFSTVEQAILLINSLNGIRYMIEAPIIYEKLNLSKNLIKNLIIVPYTSALGSSASFYTIYRYLIKRDLQWTKTEHK